MKKIITALTFFIMIGASCKKDKTEPTELSKLPAATQIGANTFGCLVNGVVFVNKGADVNNSNFRLIVDPTFQNGAFQIRVYSIQNSKYERININSNDINGTGLYHVQGNTGPIFIDYSNDNSNCNFNQSATCYLKGSLNLTRYDVANGIFSGTFQFNMKDPTFNCDTLKISEGRFDKKL